MSIEDAIPALRNIAIAARLPLRYVDGSVQATLDDQSTFADFMNRGAPSNTPARNRKRRRHPSWMRTKGRLNRALGRLPSEKQSLQVAATARKFRELLQKR